MEQELGIPVLRHSEKKPAGGTESLEEHFGYGTRPTQHTTCEWKGLEVKQTAIGGMWSCRCSSGKLIMIGDRYLTDIVYGNRHGMLTIRPRPLTAEGENLSVRWVSIPLCAV